MSIRNSTVPTEAENYTQIPTDNTPPSENPNNKTSDFSPWKLWADFNAFIEVKDNDHRITKITKNIVRGAKIGLKFYLAFYGLSRLGLCAKPMQLRPYVLNSVTRATLEETGKLIYDAALLILGKREVYENLENDDTLYAYEHLRQRSWKVISKFEDIALSADHLFSDFAGIRTAKTIRESFKSDEAYLLDSYITEITRQAIFNRIKSLYSFAISFLSCHFVQSLGYTMPGLQTLYSLPGIKRFSTTKFCAEMILAINFRSALDEGINSKQLKIDKEGNIEVVSDDKIFGLIKASNPLHFTNQPPSQT